MEMITTDELGAMMAGEFTRIHERFDTMQSDIDERFDFVDQRFDRMDERFDRVEVRLTRVEEICEDLTGKLIGVEDRLLKVEYGLEEVRSRLGSVETGVADVQATLKVSASLKLKKRVETLEKHTFGAVQSA